MRVLVADHSATLRDGAQQALRAAGHDVMLAATGLEAWQLARERGCEAAFVGWDLPALDGLELERRVGALPPKYREVLRWAYVWRTGPAKIKRTLGVTSEGLMQILRDARQMLVERMA